MFLNAGRSRKAGIFQGKQVSSRFWKVVYAGMEATDRFASGCA